MVKRLGLIGAIALGLLVFTAAAAQGQHRLRLAVINFDPTPSVTEADALADINAPVRVRIDWCRVQDPWDPMPDPDAPITPACARQDHEVNPDEKCVPSRMTYGWDAFDWSDINDAFRLYANAGVEVEDVVLQGAPQCAGRDACHLDERCSPAERYLGEWKTFVRKALSRYGPDGTFWDGPEFGPTPAAPRFDAVFWDIWNEPDNADNWNGETRPLQYAEVLQRAHAAITAHNQSTPTTVPDAKTVAGNVTFGDIEGRGYEYLRDLYRSPENGGGGARQHSDLAAFHPFDSAGPNAVENRAKKVAGIPNIQEMAITAMGWTVHPETNHAAGDSLKCVQTNDAQATKLRETLRQLFNNVPAVKRFVWFNAISQHPDTGAYDECKKKPVVNEDGELGAPVYGHYGLYRKSLTPRQPVFDVFTNRAPVMCTANSNECPAE